MSLWRVVHPVDGAGAAHRGRDLDLDVRIVADKEDVAFRTGDLVRDVGSVLVGKDAVASGLINEIGGIDRSLRKLRELVEKQEAGRQMR